MSRIHTETRTAHPPPRFTLAARAVVVAVLTAAALSVGGTAAIAEPVATAPTGAPPPCYDANEGCGLGGYDTKQSLQNLDDEYYTCNPGGHGTSPANGDACENNYEHNEDSPGSAQPNALKNGGTGAGLDAGEDH